MKHVIRPSDTKIINKLFLIGNGFDISLGLKTKYTDFLLWLLKKQILEAFNSQLKSAPFPKYKSKYQNNFGDYSALAVQGYSTNNLFDVLIAQESYRFQIEDIEKIETLEALFDFNKKFKIEIKTNFSQSLMAVLIENSKDNWVDIENIYFNFLKMIIRDKNSTESKNNDKRGDFRDRIFTINSELTYLIAYLQEYLATLEINIDEELKINHLKNFNKTLGTDDFIEFDKNQKLKIGINYFLNFNYTNSITKILSQFEDTSYQQNFIHGNLNDEEIIFGFGDEMDKIYKEIEELNENSFFKHIKSFHYFKSPNQRELQRFLNSGLYQVCIYGHSCGLSDRVMLNEIFEHENCKSIKIYYYSDEDFVNKTMEISRHFNSNQVMRKKIVDKSKDCLIPQIKVKGLDKNNI
jgi:hypothetical protein